MSVLDRFLGDGESGAWAVVPIKKLLCFEEFRLVRVLAFWRPEGACRNSVVMLLNSDREMSQPMI